MTKPFELSKQDFVRAFELVKANAGSAGIDQVSIKAYEQDLKNNLYKLWNRMSSGTYFPPAVLAVPIPKKSGGFRTLGIPTVNDRVAQMVVKLNAEPHIEPYFMSDSYGYRPNKSALDAVVLEHYFQYGGSTVIVLIQNDRAHFNTLLSSTYNRVVQAGNPIAKQCLKNASIQTC